MLFSSSKVRIVAAILLLTPLIFYWILHQEEGFVSNKDAQITSGIDYFMKDVTAKEFNTAGNLERHLSIQALQHLTKENLSELTSPSITLIAEDGEELTLNSQLGRLHDDENTLDLSGQVNVAHNPALATASTLQTEQLTVLRDEKVIKTDAPVTILNQKHSTTATGMVINYNAQTTELLSNVKGTFHVKH